MDLQKVAAQANAAAQQRPEGAKDSTGVFSTPFADMIRLPFMMASDMLTAKGDDGSALDQLTESQNQVEKPENHTSDNGEDRQANARDDSRDDNSRANNRDDDRSDERAPRSNDNRDDDNRDNHAADDSNDEAPQQARNDSDDDGSDTAKTNTGADDAGNEAETEHTSTQAADANTTTDSANSGHAADPALDGLIAAAQNANNGGAVKEAANALRDAASGPKAVKSVDAGPAVNADNANANGEQSRQTQQAQVTLERVGAQAASKAGEAVKAATDQPLVEQQAKALADTLKSDKPVKVQVNVENRTGNTVSQTAQSLNTNAVAAQENSNAQDARTSASRLDAGNVPQQTSQARVDGTMVAPGQAQAAAQTTQGTANAAAESGLSRATTQISANAPQANHGGGEGSNASNVNASNNAQQANAAQKAQQPQAARAPEQAKPLLQQISVNISKAVSEGMDRITIQLRPSELGRVEVKLEVSQNGRVSATIIADRPEALELLRNDSRNLEKALQEAGLNTQSGDLNFNLRDQQENPGETDSDTQMAGEDDIVEDGDLEAELATRILNGDLGDVISDMRVDIRA